MILQSLLIFNWNQDTIDFLNYLFGTKPSYYFHTPMQLVSLTIIIYFLFLLANLIKKNLEKNSCIIYQSMETTGHNNSDSFIYQLS